MQNASIRFALAQINTTVGDITGNSRKIEQKIAQATEAGADVVVFPELTITGYPPEDLLLNTHFLADNLKAVQNIATKSQDILTILGFVDYENNLRYNALAALKSGRLAAIYRKIVLPNYGVFDERRYFESGKKLVCLDADGVRLGVTICEDIWTEGHFPEELVFQADADVVINISASPFHVGKRTIRRELIREHASRSRAPLVYANLVGGQDELVFDGHSTILDHHGELVRYGRQFEEDLFYVDLSLEKIRNERRADMGYQQRRASWQNHTPVDVISIPAFENKASRPEVVEPVQTELSLSGATYQALVLGTRDYIQKNGFQKAVLGLSGGIDSALCATIAVDALGSENVIGIAMPSAYSSDHSVNDAEALAHNLNIEYQLLPIKNLVETYQETLAPVFKDLPEGIAEENIQARIRGNLVMALSNKFNYLALTTGNKSEVSVGYCTLYGDMAGGFAIIKDVPKVQVYELAEYRNSLSDKPVIPLNTIEKPPSAELKPDQLDQDSLPPYDVLDQILQAYVEQDLDEARIAELGFPAEQVHEIIRLVDRSEYKRRQSAPGVKITARSFGKDRRMPITNRYHLKQK